MYVFIYLFQEKNNNKGQELVISREQFVFKNNFFLFLFLDQVFEHLKAFSNYKKILFRK